MSAAYTLSDRERRAMDAASYAMAGIPDGDVLKANLLGDDEHKIDTACEIAIAFCKFAQNLKAERAELRAQLAAANAESCRRLPRRE